VECLAEVLDQASGAGAQSWHFLGGNPDESLPGILQALALTQRPRPVVWNSSLMLTPPALELLKGVVDIWLPDFKFGNDGCARRLAAVESYVGIVQGNLRLLNDQSHVVVRHVLLPGHEECCTQPVLDWVRLHCPRFRLHAFPMQEPGRVPSRPNQ
jgi:putative pyruvate formate lyase activating enzyme